jgi:glycerol uptake facilitator-like aquaporin
MLECHHSVTCLHDDIGCVVDALEKKGLRDNTLIRFHSDNGVPAARCSPVLWPTCQLGMTVMTGAFAVGDISSGAFNPAVALGICLLGIYSWENIWIYLVANFAAAVVAAVIFQVLNPPLQTTPIATDEPPYQTPR